MPQIAHIAALWSLRGHPDGKPEWSLEKKMRAIAAAGFDGIGGGLTAEHRPLADKVGLKYLLGAFSSSDPAEFATLIRKQKEAGAVDINVQLDDDDTPPRVAVRHWLQLVRQAEKIGGVEVSLEAHRDTCTETPEKTYEIAERYHDATGELIRLNFDFSHFAIVKHLRPPHFAERLLTHPDLVRNSRLCHMRTFNGHHCQVPVMLRGKLTREVKDYLAFVRELMRVWATAKSNRNATWFVCPEMGPSDSGYNVSGWRPSWPEAVTLRGELDRVWKQTLRAL